MKKMYENIHRNTHPLLSLFCILVAIMFFVVMLWTVICVVRFVVALSLGV